MRESSEWPVFSGARAHVERRRSGGRNEERRYPSPAEVLLPIGFLLLLVLAVALAANLLTVAPGP